MVTVNKKIALNTGTATFELLGLSEDTKPTGTFSGYNVGENSVFLELDTGNLYYFNGETWEEMSMSGEGGGAGLPAVTSEDNGKVLGVVEGAWDKTDAANENDFVIEATLDAESMDISNLSEDFDAIAAAAKAGKNVRIVAETPGTQDKVVYIAKLDLYIEDIDVACFSGPIPVDETVNIAVLQVSKFSGTGNTHTEFNFYPLLPPHSAADAGKVLGIDSNGEIAWVSLT